jgi:hypothetical protein
MAQLRRRRSGAAGKRIVVQLQIRIGAVGQRHLGGVGVHAGGQRSGDLHAVGHQPRLMARLQRDRLRCRRANHCHGQQEHCHQHFNEGKSAG